MKEALSVMTDPVVPVISNIPNSRACPSELAKPLKLIGKLDIGRNAPVPDWAVTLPLANNVAAEAEALPDS